MFAPFFLRNWAPKTGTTATALAALMWWAAPLPVLAQTTPASPPAINTPAPDTAGTVQATAGQDFPTDAQELSASELDTRLRGKVYTATLANGMGWRGDYKASGYVFVNTTSGGSDTGKWRTEDGKVCVEYRGRMRSGCTEVRGGAQALYAKSSTTGVVTVLQPD